MEDQREEQRKKRTVWYHCPVCGKDFKSYGYQKRVFCPHCHLDRTGKKLGASPETLAKARATAAANKAARKAAETKEKTEKQPPQSQPKKKQSIMEKLLNKEIF